MSSLKLPVDGHGLSLKVPPLTESYRRFTLSSNSGSYHTVGDMELAFGTWILTDFSQYLTILYTVAIVHLQHTNRRAPFGCNAFNAHIVLDGEMIRPPLVTWMKERCDLLC